MWHVISISDRAQPHPRFKEMHFVQLNDSLLLIKGFRLSEVTCKFGNFHAVKVQIIFVQ